MVTWSSWRCSLQLALKCRPWCSTGGSHSHRNLCGYTPTIWGSSCTALWGCFHTAHNDQLTTSGIWREAGPARVCAAPSSRLAASSYQAGPACTGMQNAQRQAGCYMLYGRRKAGNACKGTLFMSNPGRQEQGWSPGLCKVCIPAGKAVAQATGMQGQRCTAAHVYLHLLHRCKLQSPFST